MLGTGTRLMLAGNMGKGKAFDIAIADFTNAYHQQVGSDPRLMLEAIESGRFKAKGDI